MSFPSPISSTHQALSRHSYGYLDRCRHVAIEARSLKFHAFLASHLSLSVGFSWFRIMLLKIEISVNKISSQSSFQTLVFHDSKAHNGLHDWEWSELHRIEGRNISRDQMPALVLQLDRGPSVQQRQIFSGFKVQFHRSPSRCQQLLPQSYLGWIDI